MMNGHSIDRTVVFILGFEAWITSKIHHNYGISTDGLMADKLLPRHIYDVTSDLVLRSLTSWNSLQKHVLWRAVLL